MTAAEFMLALPQIDNEAYEEAKDLLDRNAREVLENTYVDALMTIMRVRARGALQALMSVPIDDIPVARARLDAFQAFFGEILRLDELARKKKEKD